MVEYSVPGFKMSFPENFKRKGKFPYVTIREVKTKDKLSIILLSRRTNFEDECKLKLDPALTGNKSKSLMRIIRHEVIRAGEYCAFVGAKEKLISKIFVEDLTLQYYWTILIPVKNRVVEVLVVVNGQRMSGPNDNFAGLNELESTWRPIIDSLEFEADIVADIPDTSETVQNAYKRVYSFKGWKLSYPETLKVSGDTFYFILEHPVTKGMLSISILLDTFDYDFNAWYNDSSCRVNPKNIKALRRSTAESQQDTLRIGDFPKFPKAKEILLRDVDYLGFIKYSWELLLPIGKRIVSITAMSDDLVEMEDVWQPIVESIEFDPVRIDKLPSIPETPKFSWKKSTSGRPQRFHYELDIDMSFVGLCDSQIELSPKYFLNSFEAVEGKKFAKVSRQLMLETYYELGVLPVDFYLNTDPPAENDPAWDQIIEGFINLSSGKLFVNDSFDDDPSLEIVLPQKGIYKFRVYYGGLDYKLSEVEEHWQIYLWLTDETKETNEIKVIKAFTKAEM